MSYSHQWEEYTMKCQDKVPFFSNSFPLSFGGTFLIALVMSISFGKWLFTFFFLPRQTLFMHIPDYILLQVSQDRKAPSPENKKLLGSNW